MMKILIVIVLFLVQVSCAYVPPEPDPEYATVRPVFSRPLPINDGSIFKDGFERTLFEDLRARRVGDIITIILSESTNASKSASTSSSKESAVDFGIPSVFGGLPTRNGVPILQNSIEAERDFTGEGETTQSNSLSGSVTVTIVEVLPNGNLMVRGEKLLTLNQGSERIQISGIIRVSDISPTNTVSSTQVANAKIIYAGEGVLADANNPGWFTRFVNSGWWPF